uniref:Nicotinate-nucleotide pyrophosphorylase [carboxylating] n=1 Tax=Amphora coffeiformis TaxID=265554 RepID=A0A7S3L4S8_9STRA|eukprot:scaffold5731_cov126-Amphora_coffeaeformis.AAC.1
MASPTNFGALIPQERLDETVRQWILDDIPSFDVGGLVVGTNEKEATLWMKSPGVFAGKPFFDAVFRVLGCQIQWKPEAVEGKYFDASGSNKIPLATVVGPVNKILQGERTALNTLSRCSGVASASRESAKVAESLGWKGYTAGTRKTTPGFRIVEKYGLLVGGVATHRLDLSQMVMLKDNHIWAAGSITKAVQLARQAAGFSQKIEVECQSKEEAIEAARAGADIVMLDNFEPAKLKEDAKSLKEEFPHLLIEASGGITVKTMADYLSEHVDILSQGKLTQGYGCLDFSLKISH